MNEKNMQLILRLGLIGCLICLTGAIFQLTQPSPGSKGRTVAILLCLTAAVESLSFLLQLRQKRP